MNMHLEMLLEFMSSSKPYQQMQSRLSHFYRKHFDKIEDSSKLTFVLGGRFLLPCKSPVGRTMELEPWFVPRFPARIFSPRGFLQWGQVFSGLRLTAFVSVVDGSSTLTDFSRASLFHFCAFQCPLRSVDPE